MGAYEYPGKNTGKYGEWIGYLLVPLLGFSGGIGHTYLGHHSRCEGGW